MSLAAHDWAKTTGKLWREKEQKAQNLGRSGGGRGLAEPPRGGAPNQPQQQKQPQPTMNNHNSNTTQNSIPKLDWPKVGHDRPSPTEIRPKPLRTHARVLCVVRSLPSAGPPSARQPKNSLFFFRSPATIFFIYSLGGVFS